MKQMWLSIRQQSLISGLVRKIRKAHILQMCRYRCIWPLHVRTESCSDQVYSACKEDGPYIEEVVKPGNIYAEHKLEMEERVLELVPSAVMLRAEWMYDYVSPKPNYFLNVLHASQQVSFSSRQFRGITYLKEVVENMDHVMSLSGGAYNFGSETTQSMYEITEQFLQLLGKDVQLQDALPRHNLWMNCEKARKYGVEFSDASDGLKRCLNDYKTTIKQ